MDLNFQSCLQTTKSCALMMMAAAAAMKDAIPISMPMELKEQVIVAPNLVQLYGTARKLDTSCKAVICILPVACTLLKECIYDERLVQIA